MTLRSLERRAICPARRRGAATLVDVDGGDEHGADGDLLPERLHADDDEAVLQHGRDEQADDRAEDRADAAEEADVPPITTAAITFRLVWDWPAMAVVPNWASDRIPAKPASSAGQRVDHDQVPVHLDADPAADSSLEPMA